MLAEAAEGEESFFGPPPSLPAKRNHGIQGSGFRGKSYTTTMIKRDHNYHLMLSYLTILTERESS